MNPLILNRRHFLKSAAAVSAASMMTPAGADPLAEGLKSSDLVYLSPIKSNGQESACQAEIWFVYDGADIFVCTGTDSWRAKAPTMGLNMTKFWVGDLGQWKNTNGDYKKLPSLMAKASIEPDTAEHERILDLFAKKYPLSWVIWGPRFRKGLNNGKRTMLRYKPTRTV